MQPIVIELQANALDTNISVSNLLRKSLVVATKLNLTEFEEWIKNEQNGYSGVESAPSYRTVNGEPKAFNPVRGWIPIQFESASEHKIFSQRTIGMPISELEALINAKDDGRLQIPYSPETQEDFRRAGGYDFQCSLKIQMSSVVGLIDQVRNVILNWTLKLEGQGILGEKMIFSAEEKSIAQGHHYHINNFFGPANDTMIQQSATNSNQSKIVTDSSVLTDLKSLLKDIKPEIEKANLDIEVSGELSSELQTLEAQSTSPKPKESIIRASLCSIKRILEGLTVTALSGFLPKVVEILSQLPQLFK